MKPETQSAESEGGGKKIGQSASERGKGGAGKLKNIADEQETARLLNNRKFNQPLEHTFLEIDGEAQSFKQPKLQS